jgi:Na+-transporting methylmalonyl-CoA/oxaloacetate decarboxylase gamma subunit
MDANVSAGLSIALLGMVIVFSFIVLLALVISLLARFRGEMEPVADEGAVTPGATAELLAVISAALHTHRAVTESAERREES